MWEQLRIGVASFWQKCLVNFQRLDVSSKQPWPFECKFYRISYWSSWMAQHFQRVWFVLQINLRKSFSSKNFRMYNTSMIWHNNFYPFTYYGDLKVTLSLFQDCSCSSTYSFSELRTFSSPFWCYKHYDLYLPTYGNTVSNPTPWCRCQLGWKTRL